jgi:hypothetical protein
MKSWKWQGDESGDEAKKEEPRKRLRGGLESFGGPVWAMDQSCGYVEGVSGLLIGVYQC